jgi:CRISPR-associated protein Csb3
MNPRNHATISVRVDPANPGQFFACCGLLELADRFMGWGRGLVRYQRILFPGEATN